MSKHKHSILFQNIDFVIVNKPAGLLVIPDRYDETKPCLKNILLKEFDEVFVVHRIDMETSGVICFALNANAHKYLSEMFLNHTVEKTYHAICSSLPKKEKGSIDLPILQVSGKNKMISSPKGKAAITHYEVKEALGSMSLLEVKIETGRTHQIRVHLKEILCPLLVDRTYGKSDTFYLSQIKGRKYNKRREEIERPLMSRHSLHSYRIRFKDQSGKIIEASAPYPKDFKAVLNQLRKLSTPKIF